MRTLIWLAALAALVAAAGCGGGGGGSSSGGGTVGQAPLISEVTLPAEVAPLDNLTITARVTDPDGAADLTGVSAHLPWGPVVAMPQQGDLFRYSGAVPTGIMAGDCIVEVIARDHGRNVTVSKHTMKVLGRVSGVVTRLTASEEMEPVAGALVRLVGTSYQATTSGSGSFSIVTAPGTAGHLQVAMAGLLTVNSDHLVLDRDVARGLVLLDQAQLASLYQRFDLPAQPGAGTLLVNPTAKDAQGQDVTLAGCNMSVQPPAGPAFEVGISTSNLLWGLNMLPGTYQVQVVGPGGTWPLGQCSLSAGELTVVSPWRRSP